MRSRTLATAISAALLATGAAVALPAAANAATPASASFKLPITVSVAAASQTLRPGGPADAVTIKAHNTTAKAVDLNLEQLGLISEPLVVTRGELSLKLTAEGRTPATEFDLQAQNGPFNFGPAGGIAPKGHPNAAFVLPAGATFTWQLSVGVNKNWPVTDNRLNVYTSFEEQGKTSHGSAGVTLGVGDLKTGGPILVSVAGGAKVAPGRPALEKVTVTNRTGVALPQSLRFGIGAFPFGPVNQVAVKVYEWVGAHGKVKAHWQDVTKSGFVVPAGLKNNASVSTWFAISEVFYKAKAASERGDLWVFSQDLVPTAQDQWTQNLTFLR